jgi:hypothetical protein
VRRLTAFRCSRKHEPPQLRLPGWSRSTPTAPTSWPMTPHGSLASLLAQQGLRATSGGGHYAVESAVRAQFGEGFRPFADLRRRRNELGYPHLPADAATAEEAKQAVEVAQQLIAVAGQLLDQLSFFAQPQKP